MKPLHALLFLLALALTGCPPGSSGGDDDDSASDDDDAGNPQIEFETSLGTFVIELWPDVSPITVTNFEAYVDSGFYDGEDKLDTTIFHRVIEGFVIQGGGLNTQMEPKDTMDPIVNESYDGPSNLRGTVAMARTAAPDTATSQFYVNLVDNTFLDSDGTAAGYTVFGEVVEGMDAVDTIAVVPTGNVLGWEDAPIDQVSVISVTRL